MLSLFNPLSRDPSLGGLVDIDASEILAFLERINEDCPVKITITHVMLKIIGDSFRRFPELNVKIVGRRLYQLEHVDVRVAVNLFPDEQGAPEVALAMIRDVDRKSITELARELAPRAEDWRRTGARKNIRGSLLRLTNYVPDFLYAAAMEAGREMLTNGRIAVLGIARDPMGSTGLTNVGSFGFPEGAHNMIASGLLPPFGYASLFMVLPVVKKPLVVDGEVCVRPVLPLGAGLDHRAIDGYKAFRYFRYWTEVLTHPDEHMSEWV